MGLKVVLWESQPKEDGSCAIKLYLHRDKSKYYSLKQYCHPKEFDYSAGRVKRTRANWQLINSAISAAQARFEEIMIKYPKFGVDLIVDMYEQGSVPKDFDGIIPFIDQFIKDCESKKIQRALNTIKKYRTLRNHLEKYSPGINFPSINKDFYYGFIQYLRDAGHKENSVGALVKNLKVFINEANERGICKVDEHKRKYFKVPTEETDAIYLTEEEVSRLITLDLSRHPHLVAERDRFIVSTYLMLRYSDSIRIEKDMIFEQTVGKEKRLFFRQRNQKTSEEVIMPVNQVVNTILKRNNYKFHHNTNQESNWKLKEIACIAKIDDKLIMNGKTFKKYQLVTTHTARRSGATNYYLAGIDKKTLMQFGGWKKEETMLKYIRVSKLEAAINMAGHAMFK